MLNRILEIIAVNGFTIVCRWQTGEVRAISMEEHLKQWAEEEGSVYKRLLDPSVFNKVMLDKVSKTLYWEGLLQWTDDAGQLIDAALDIDPDVLYSMSTQVDGYSNKPDQGSRAA